MCAIQEDVVRLGIQPERLLPRILVLETACLQAAHFLPIGYAPYF